MSSKLLLDQLYIAFNNHDIELLINCFAIDYNSEQPVYPDRIFQGSEQVRKNWSSNFEEMPDFSAKLLNHETGSDLIWAEWEWQGTRQNKSKLHMRGVTIFGVTESKIKWGRLYMETVKEDGKDIETAVKEVMQGKIKDES